MSTTSYIEQRCTTDEAGDIAIYLGVPGTATPELRSIIGDHLLTWSDLFAYKNAEYGGGAAFDLGERGQFSDMYRKMIKLKRAMWDEDESVLNTEGVDEILMDLIGHCFLTLEMRKRARSGEYVECPRAESADAPQAPTLVSPEGGVRLAGTTRWEYSVVDTDDNCRREAESEEGFFSPWAEPPLTRMDLDLAAKVETCSSEPHKAHWRNKTISLACPGA